MGIPTNPLMALMIGALMIQGIQPGPSVIRERRPCTGAWWPACGSAI
jgi:TctA family transporter